LVLNIFVFVQFEVLKVNNRTEVSKTKSQFGVLRIYALYINI